MIIGGWGKKSKKIADAGFFKCENCNNIATFEVHELANSISLYFIPVAKWSKKVYLVCSICQAGYELSESDTKKLLQETATLPDNITVAKIWNKMDSLFVKFTEGKKSLEGWDEFAIDELSKTYKEDDIEYILAHYNQGLIDSLDEQATHAREEK